MTAGGATRPRLAFFLPSLYGGGAERVVLNLAAGFAQRGFPTDLLLGAVEGEYLSQVPDTIRVVDLKASRMLGCLLPLAAYLSRERPAALLSALDHANLVAMAASRISRGNTRIVISVHCTYVKARQGSARIRERAIPWLLGRLHRWADGIVAVSDGVADDLAATTGIPRERINVIYNGVITPALLAAASLRPDHPWFEDARSRVILGVGRLTPQKNFPLLIEAFALVRRDRDDVRLVILGEGPDRPALEALVRRLGVQDSVALPGFVGNPYACMAHAALIVLSSDFEGLPTVLIEGLAVGTPVVSTDCESGPREILRGGVLGELVPVGDIRTMAQAIARTLISPLPAPGSPALRQFTLSAVVDQFHSAFGLDA